MRGIDDMVGRAPPLSADAEAAGVSPSSDAVQPARSDAATVQLVSSDSLFSGARELHIEHHGALYRLKQTALGKLILTK